MHTGVVTNVSDGVWVQIPALKAEYGPLSYLDDQRIYTKGDRVLVGRVGPDEYVVLGIVHP